MSHGPRERDGREVRCGSVSIRSGNRPLLFPWPRNVIPRHVAHHLATADADSACERGANTLQSTRVHARVTLQRRIASVCGPFVAAVTLPCPRFPRLSQDGKQGVESSSLARPAIDTHAAAMGPACTMQTLYVQRRLCLFARLSCVCCV
jgi:hypothetical protein